MKKQRKRVLTITEFASMGGKACAAKLTPEQRSANARHAIRARWKRVRAEQKEQKRQAKKQAEQTAKPQPVV